MNNKENRVNCKLSMDISLDVKAATRGKKVKTKQKLPK